MLSVGSLAITSACVGNAPREPTVATTNFAPKLLLDVNDEGFMWKRGPRDDPSVSVPGGDEAPTVYPGTVMEVTNTGRNEHRLDAGRTFDTGQMKPGDTTIIAFTEELTEPKAVEIVDRDAPDRRTSINLVPRPESSR